MSLNPPTLPSGMPLPCMLTTTAMKQLHSATDAFLKESVELLSAPLPAVYSVSPMGAPEAQAQAAELLGPRADMDRLREITRNLGEGMESDVLAPVQQWLFAWQAVRKRAVKLEETRIDVDARRRVVRSLQQKSESQRSGIARATSERGRGKLEQSLESTWRLTQHKEAKLSMALDHFAQFEGEVSEELQGLIRDAVCLKSYLSACMELEREAFRAAGRALYDGAPSPGATHSVDSGARGGGGGGAGSQAARGDSALGEAPNPFEDDGSSAGGYEARIVAGQAKGHGNSKSDAARQMYGDDIQLPAPDNYPSPRW